MKGIEVSGTSKYYENRPNYMRVGRDVLANKTPLSQKVSKEKFGPRNEATVAEEQFARYSSRRTLLNTGKNTYNLNGASLILAEHDPSSTGPRMATLSYNGKGGQEEITFSLTSDTRITWDDQGNPLILQGSDALTKGVLKAVDNGEILIRTSAGVVDGGEGKSTVINLGENGGFFKGGKGGTTYYGSYLGSNIVSGEGENNFYGVFTDCSITGSKGNDAFAGFFLGSIIKSGDGDDTFSGLFLKGCELHGEDGDDKFTGEFNQAVLFGGAGKNYYGLSVEESHYSTGGMPEAKKNRLEEKYKDEEKAEDRKAASDGSEPEDGQEVGKAGTLLDVTTVVSGKQNSRPAIEQQFMNVQIDDQGDESILESMFVDSNITLGNGKHRVTGVLYDSEIDAAQAESSDINLAFATQSKVKGSGGDDNIRVTTAEYTSVSTGLGQNNVTMGADDSRDSRVIDLGGKRFDLENIEFIMPGQDTETGLVRGHLMGNLIDASGADTHVTVATGDATERMHVTPDEKKTEEDADAASEENTQTSSAATDDAEKDLRIEGGNAGAVTVRMSEKEQRHFEQSYEARRSKQHSYCTFSSQYNFSKQA